MIQTNLEKSPEFAKETKELIEKSFGYDSNNSFDVDFYPLFNKENFKNCHILIDDTKVIAHIGVKQRMLQEHKLNMYGGIAINENYRGQGVFKRFFNSLLDEYSNCSLHLLWSDKLELYKKFNFHAAGELHQYKEKRSEHEFLVKQVDWHNFPIRSLYNNKEELRLSRSSSDWQDLEQISSSELYLVKEGEKIINYFIKNKGADLTNIIHEYGFLNLDQLKVMQNFGTVWSPQNIEENETLFSTVAKVGDTAQFKALVQDLSGLSVKAISYDNIQFTYDGLEINLSHPKFLNGIIGPGRFKELDQLKPLFISGLDSI